MTRRQVVVDALEFRRPAYVPWAWDMTAGCAERARQHLGLDDLSDFIDSHFLDCGSDIRPAGWPDADHVRDQYGGLWDRTVDKDIGTPCEPASSRRLNSKLPIFIGLGLRPTQSTYA